MELTDLEKTLLDYLWLIYDQSGADPEKRPLVAGRGPIGVASAVLAEIRGLREDYDEALNEVSRLESLGNQTLREEDVLKRIEELITQAQRSERDAG